MENLIYIRPGQHQFYETDGGFLGLRTEICDFGRVSIIRAFPLSHENLYLSVRDHEQKEIGMIHHLEDYLGEERKLIEKDLERRYFLPTILRIQQVKQEFGYYYWTIETDRGIKEFISRKDSSQVKIGRAHV